MDPEEGTNVEMANVTPVRGRNGLDEAMNGIIIF